MQLDLHYKKEKSKVFFKKTKDFDELTFYSFTPCTSYWHTTNARVKNVRKYLQFSNTVGHKFVISFIFKFIAEFKNEIVYWIISELVVDLWKCNTL